ncbi:MAG: HAMP domain-containing histidine kinase [Clostridiales bacterium]|jgi:two-component system phosphate regulon sensor histidine kinase PhoR|nr:HAMP domain-containing histidine kinase [Clostridiales bacterium]
MNIFAKLLLNLAYAIEPTSVLEARPVADKCATIKNGFILREADLQRRLKTMGIFIDNMREGLIIIDKNGLTLTFNSSALNIFRYKHELPTNILRVTRDTGFIAAVKSCLTGRRVEFTLNCYGKVFDVFLNPVAEWAGGGYTVDSEGMGALEWDLDTSASVVSGAVILLLDKTEKQLAELQRREFSANVSHELKTPLTVILGYCEMLEKGMIKPQDVQEIGAKVAGQTRRLINLVEDIIRLSEFEEGRIIAERARFDIYDALAAAMEEIKERAAAKGLTIQAQGRHFNVCANKRMLDELLFNLLDNAVKYTNEGDITAKVSNDGDTYTITVKDTGIGIAPEHIARVFERFYRADRSRSSQGTGLGLAIVKHIAELHGGGVSIESNERDGTQVTCVLNNA